MSLPSSEPPTAVASAVEIAVPWVWMSLPEKNRLMSTV